MLRVLNRSGIVTLSLQKVTRFAQGLVNSTSSLRTPETSVLVSALLSYLLDLSSATYTHGHKISCQSSAHHTKTQQCPVKEAFLSVISFHQARKLFPEVPPRPHS